MKSGLDVRVVKRPEISEHGNDLRDNAHTIASTFGDTMVGYFIVAWDAKAQYSTGLHVAPAQEGGVSISLFPAWVAEVARRETVTTRQIHDVLEQEYVKL